MDQNLCNRREVHMGNAFTSDDFQKCLRKLEATGPLRIPPNVHNDGRSQAMRKACGRISAYDEYVTWMLSENSQLLRLVWSSACGKTGLSEFLVEKLKQKTRDCPEATLACFFCDNQKFGGDTPAAILRSLLFQLLLQRTRLYQYIRADFEKGGAGGSFEDHLNDFSGLWRNLRDMLQDEQAGPVFIMIDALDACRGPARQDLLRSIRDLFHSLSSKTEAKVKLLITYTPDSLDIDKELGHVGAGLDLGERKTGANFAKNAWNVTENFSTAMIQDSYCKPLETTNHENYISTIESLLNRGAGMASKDNRYGRSPLSWAAESGQESMVKLLLDRGVDIECQDKLGQTPLSFAAKTGHEAVVRLLVCSGGRIDTKDGNGYTPLLRAAKNGHLPVVVFLLGNGAGVQCKSNNGQTPVSVAAENGHSAIVHALLANGAAADSTDCIYGRTPLSFAAEKGHENICQALCERGVDVDSKDIHHQTPLLWAAINGHEGSVGRLLHHGAITSVKDSRYNQTPMIWACRNGHESIVKLLMATEADVNLGDKSGRTPLSWAAGNGWPGVMKLLLNGGAKVNTSDQHGRTPLSWAAGNGKTDPVRQLLDRNAECTLGDRHGRTPTAWALENAYGCIVTLLREENLRVRRGALCDKCWE